MKRDRFTKKDALLLGSIYAGLLSLVVLLPENNPLLTACVLAATTIVSLVFVQRIR